jgi:hypothetical protein
MQKTNARRADQNQNSIIVAGKSCGGFFYDARRTSARAITLINEGNI